MTDAQFQIKAWELEGIKIWKPHSRKKHWRFENKDYLSLHSSLPFSHSTQQQRYHCTDRQHYDTPDLHILTYISAMITIVYSCHFHLCMAYSFVLTARGMGQTVHWSPFILSEVWSCTYLSLIIDNIIIWVVEKYILWFEVCVCESIRVKDYNRNHS